MKTKTIAIVLCSVSCYELKSRVLHLMAICHLGLMACTCFCTKKIKAGFHQGQSRRRGRIQKVERYHLVKLDRRSRKQNTDSAYDSVAYDQVKTTLSESQEDRSGRINQWQCSIPGLAIGWFFRFCFRLQQPSFPWIISEGALKRNRKRWKRSDSSEFDSVELMTPLTTPIRS